MGIIKAMSGSIGGNLGDQWLEVIESKGFLDHVLLKTGSKMTSVRSSNTKGTLDVISNGSQIIVGEGECALSVENGKILDVFSEPGVHEFHSENSASIFAGDGFKSIAKNTWDRFGYGGDVHIVQKIYYVNTKEIMNNPFKTKGGIHFRVADNDHTVGMDFDMMAELSGVYSFRISDPVAFYKNVAHSGGYCSLDTLKDQLETEILSLIQTIVVHLCEDGMRPLELPQHTDEIGAEVEFGIKNKWSTLRGLDIVSVAIEKFRISEYDNIFLRKTQYYNMFLTDTAPGTWKCPICGNENKGQFCTECGEKKV